jgi:hypothetical protein
MEVILYNYIQLDSHYIYILYIIYILYMNLDSHFLLVIPRQFPRNIIVSSHKIVLNRFTAR